MTTSRKKCKKKGLEVYRVEAREGVREKNYPFLMLIGTIKNESTTFNSFYEADYCPICGKSTENHNA